MSFNGPSLRSYGWYTIGILAPGRDGAPAAIFTGDTYSSSTAQHTSAGRSATRHLRQFIIPGRLDLGTDPADYRARWVESIRAAREKVKRGANYIQRGRAWQALVRVETSAREFCAFFGLPMIRRSVAPARVSSDLGRLEQYDASAQERAQARAAARAEEWARREAFYRQSWSDRLAQWLDGAPGAIGYHGSDGFDYLRIAPSDPDTVETTRGARVPLEHIRRAAPLVLRALRSGRAVEFGADGPRLGYYRLDRIGADGSARVGCHTFARPELERFAQVIGADLSGPDSAPDSPQVETPAAAPGWTEIEA